MIFLVYVSVGDGLTVSPSALFKTIKKKFLQYCSKITTSPIWCIFVGDNSHHMAQPSFAAKTDLPLSELLKWLKTNNYVQGMTAEITLSLDLPKKKKVSWFDKQMDEIAKGSISKQLVVGGVSGWCAGIVFTKVGKTAASALAGGLLLFQIAQHQGYIKVNWPKLHKDIEKAKHKFNNKTKKELPWILEEIQQFVQDNKFLVTGFGGGFLLGLATF